MKSYLAHHTGAGVYAVPSLYNDGSTAIILVDKEGEKVATASINLGKEYTLPWFQIFISPEEGIIETLINGHVIGAVKEVKEGKYATITDKRFLRDLRKLRKQLKVEDGNRARYERLAMSH